MKIMLGAVVVLGLVSGIIMFFSNKKAVPVAAPKTTVQATTEVKPLTPLPIEQKKVTAPQKSPVSVPVKKVDPDAAIKSQWTACSNKSMLATKNLFWKVQIIEGIPTGGTYAKGILNENATMPVHVVVKSDSKVIEKIKSMLIVGKTVTLRGNCGEVAADGSVILQAF